MIKKCKQCGCILASGENNKVCENCRQKKRNKRLEVNEGRKKKKI
ncbi:hypothetical protein [Aminipila sp.]|nr:hypothetical protein [Aminipila sp.]